MLRKLLGSPPARLLTKGVMLTAGYAGRLASVCRTKALFPASDCICHWSVEVKYPENVTLGKRVIIGPHSTIGASAEVFLGDHVRLSKGVLIETGGLDFAKDPPLEHIAKPIRIERGVWLGAGSMVLGGVTIGENSVIGAGAVVRKNVPPLSLVTGENCRVRLLEKQYSAHIAQKKGSVATAPRI
jgi:acetyltransferase-like isoleucine patch superfamily enzyme